MGWWDEGVVLNPNIPWARGRVEVRTNPSSSTAANDDDDDEEEEEEDALAIMAAVRSRA